MRSQLVKKCQETAKTNDWVVLVQTSFKNLSAHRTPAQRHPATSHSNAAAPRQGVSLASAPVHEALSQPEAVCVNTCRARDKATRSPATYAWWSCRHWLFLCPLFVFLPRPVQSASARCSNSIIARWTDAGDTTTFVVASCRSEAWFLGNITCKVVNNVMQHRYRYRTAPVVQ